MKRTLWKLAVFTNPAAADAVAELVQSTFHLSPVVDTDADSSRTVVSVYAERRGQLHASGRAALANGLRRLRSLDVPPDPAHIRVARVRPENWAESWKKHFPPLRIGSALLIKPSWSPVRPKRGQALVVLDPGLSFGTGHHATTRFCLQQLVACCDPRRLQAVLDIGTGSGILAIAAVRLGYAPVQALDVDPEAVRVAKANARANRVLRHVRFACADLRTIARSHPGRFDVVCANLTADLLIEQRRTILRRLNPHGVLVLAGILKRQFPAVRRAYRAAGLRLIHQDVQGEWHSAAFAHSAP